MNTQPTLAALAVSTVLASMNVDAGTVRTERVTFNSNGEKLVGTLYLPSDVSAARMAPGVVVTGAWMTIKEQMPAVYARELAERGYVALAFDFRGWGESTGKVRVMEDPRMKIDDIKAAVRFLDARAETAPNEIGGLGICASAGYMVTAAAESRDIKSVALVAPWLHDRAIVNQVYGGEQGVAKLIAVAKAAEDKQKKTGEQTLVPAASKTDKTAVMFDVPYYTEKGRGLISQWENQFNVASWNDWLEFDGLAAATKVTQPTYVVHSEAAAIPQGAKAFLERLQAPKGSLWLDSVNQFDFYDREAPVNTASNAVAQHFGKTLGTSANKHGGGADAALPAVGDPEAARIVSVVSSIPLAVDLARYDLAEAAFAPQVTIDYTSLWGGEPQQMTPAALMQAWRGIVPGFDATWHELSDVRVQRTGDRATAVAAVDGRHWIGAELWRPVGNYVWDLEKREGRWVVTRMVFQMTQEIGDRGLAAKAMERVKTRQAANTAG
jgi:dienelactone hydrolase